MKTATVRAGIVVLALAVLLGATACRAGQLRGMQPVPPGRAVSAPSEGMARVVFLRPSGYAWADSSSVFEIGDAGDRFVGIVPAKKKIAYAVGPGVTRFMVIGERADFLDADLQGGKTYYVLVTPQGGRWKTRFAFRPVPATDAALSGWLEDCQEIENTDRSRAWAREHESDIEKKKTKNLPKWLERADRPRLRAADGR